MLILYGDNLLSTDQIIEAPDWDDDGTYDIKEIWEKLWFKDYSIGVHWL